MEIEVKLAKCEGHGLCAEAAPDVYEIDADGYVKVSVSPGELVGDLESSAEAGARVCPVAALTVHR